MGRLPRLKSRKLENSQRIRNQKYLLMSLVVFQASVLLLILSSLSAPWVSGGVELKHRIAVQVWTSTAQPLFQYQRRSKNQSVNFQAKIIHGNIKTIHVNIRSMFNKMKEVKQLVHKEKPHILGISEAELRKRSHSLDHLKVPGYVLLLPKSWNNYGRARVVVYVKKTLEYEQLLDIEHEDIQSIWIKAGF